MFILANSKSQGKADGSCEEQRISPFLTAKLWIMCNGNLYNVLCYMEVAIYENRHRTRTDPETCHSPHHVAFAKGDVVGSGSGLGGRVFGDFFFGSKELPVLRRRQK